MPNPKLKRVSKKDKLPSVQDLLIKCDLVFKAGNYNEAMRLYQVVMDNALADSDEYNKALEGYTKAVEDKNTEATKKIEAWLEQAEKALAGRDYDVALAYVDELEEEQKKNLLGVKDISAELMKRMLEVRDNAGRFIMTRERTSILLQQGKDSLEKGNYDEALQSFNLAFSESSNEEARLLIQQAEKVREKYFKIIDAINLANKQVDILEFNMAENTLRMGLESISVSDMQENVLTGIINLARDFLSKVRSYQFLEDQVDVLIDNSNAAFLEEDYEGALKLLDAASILLSNAEINSSRVNTLIGDVRKKKSERDQILSFLLLKAKEVLKSNDDELIKQFSQQLQKYKSISKEVEVLVKKLKQKSDLLTAQRNWRRGIQEFQTGNPNDAYNLLVQSHALDASYDAEKEKTLREVANVVSVLQKVKLMLDYNLADDAVKLIEPIQIQYPLNKYIADVGLRAIEQKIKPEPSSAQKIFALIFILLSLFFLFRLLNLI